MANFLKKMLIASLVLCITSSSPVFAETWGEWIKDLSSRAWQEPTKTCGKLFGEVQQKVNCFLLRNRLHPNSYDPVLIRNVSVIVAALIVISLPKLVGGDSETVAGENETSGIFFSDEAPAAFSPQAFVEYLQNQEALTQIYTLVGDQCCVAFAGTEKALAACVNIESVKEVFLSTGIDDSDTALEACEAFWMHYFAS